MAKHYLKDGGSIAGVADAIQFILVAEEREVV
jgi:hypothetical protein